MVNVVLNIFTALDIQRVLGSKDPEMKKVADGFTKYETQIMWFMVVVRVIMLLVMPYIHGSGHKLIAYPFKYWAPFYVIYALIFFVAGNNVSDLSYSMLVFDTAMFLF